MLWLADDKAVTTIIQSLFWFYSYFMSFIIRLETIIYFIWIIVRKTFATNIIICQIFMSLLDHEDCKDC